MNTILLWAADVLLGSWSWAALIALALAIAGTTLAAMAAAAWFRECREYRRLALEETQRICDYLNARAEIAYLKAKFDAQEAEEPW